MAYNIVRIYLCALTSRGFISCMTGNHFSFYSKGMIAWLTQGLEKVVPHPELKNKDSPPAEPPAEVRPATAPGECPEDSDFTVSPAVILILVFI